MEGTNEVYREVLSDAELVTMPNAPFLKEYSAAINSAVDSVLLGGSPEEALGDEEERGRDLPLTGSDASSFAAFRNLCRICKARRGFCQRQGIPILCGEGMRGICLLIL